MVDADYRGNVGVILFNFGSADFEVAAGDRVAQLILEKICMAEIEDVGDAELPDTVRGAGGFGSTGLAGDTKSSAIEVAAAPVPGMEAVNAADEGSVKRAKVASAESAESPLLPMAQMLVFINKELAAIEGLDWAAVKSEFSSHADAKPLLKGLALSSDERLFAAMQAFQATGDAADLADTLAIILA